MVDFLAKGAKITGTNYASLQNKLRKSIKTKRCGMLTMGAWTPEGRFSSSQLVYILLRQKLGPAAMNPSSPSLLSRPCTT